MRTITIVGIIAAFLIILVSIFTYTSDVAAISEVEIQLEGIDKIKTTLHNVTLTTKMNISNPTGRTIQDLSSTFDIYVGDTKIGSGTFQGVTINPQSSTKATTEILITSKELLHSGIDYFYNLLGGKETTVTIDGTMNSTIFFGLTQTTQEFTGTLKRT